jgi:Protein BYPASS1-related
VRFKSCSLRLLVIMVLLGAAPCFCQDSAHTRVPVPQAGSLPGEEPTGNDRTEKIEKDMQKKENQERQAQLKKDTEKLLELSTELKQYVEKTNENVLSVNVIKKAEEIEKLAHSVKEKMKGN